MTLLTELTRSIAPPIPLTSLPGMIQLARSPFDATYRPPRIVMSRWPPLMTEKAIDDGKMTPPFLIVTVSLPALIRSGSSWPTSGYSPIPRRPFSAWKYTFYDGSTKLATVVGIPIPKLTYIFGLISLAALLATLILIYLSSSVLAEIYGPPGLLRVSFSILFYSLIPFTTLSTKMPGQWISSGFNSPTSTISSASAITIFPAVAQSGLKFLAVTWNTRLPSLSAFQHLTKEKSPVIASSKRYLLPLNSLTSLGLLYERTFPPGPYLVGISPVSRRVPAPVGE